MFDEVKIKIRALIEDLSESNTEVFTYTTSAIFTLAEPNIIAISEVTKNGVALGDSDYSFSATTNKVTVTATLAADDEIEINSTCYLKYSETELREFIRAALIYCSLWGTKDFELEDDGDDSYTFEPTPNQKELDMIALVTSIIIKPNYTKYELKGVVVMEFPKNIDKDSKIRKTILQLQSMNGIFTHTNLED